jgi:endonuclease/exonuclease/phosphatase family metal-dependent hydrolase
LLTWNVHGSQGPNLELLAEVVEGYTPDVLVLQEVQRRQARRLARRLGWRHTWARKHYPYSPVVWWRAEGLAVLSVLPTSHVVRTAISRHASTWTYRHRVLLAVTVTRGVAALRVYDTHLASGASDERIAQARRVAEIVVQEGAPVAAVAGDLNTHPFDLVEIVREFHPAGLRDAGGDSTNPAIAPHQRLDIVLVPERAVVTDQHVPDGGEEWSRLSDHLPVLMEFEA